MAAGGFQFTLPPLLEAREPPEARGLRRDQVRLLVSTRAALESTQFERLAFHLRAGDLLVLNDSATIAAALLNGGVHLSTELPDGRWVVEIRDSALEGPVISLPQGGRLTLGEPYRGSSRLRLAQLELPRPVLEYLTRWGKPIRYQYLHQERPLEDYQTVFARRPGSAEMPSAGRAFSADVLATLACQGVRTAFLTLHTGVASLESHERPFPERFWVPRETLRLAQRTRAIGGRVIAVGTTVARALESVEDHGLEGWTERVITPQRPPVLVDGLLTGLHEPKASHLDILEALVGPERLKRDYAEALRRGYLWHEFGDLHLLLRV